MKIFRERLLIWLSPFFFKKRRQFLQGCILVIPVFFSGCIIAKQTVERVSPNTFDLDSNLSAYLVMPHDGGHGGKITHGSGSAVAFELGRSLGKRFKKVHITQKPLELQEAIGKAKKLGYSYVFTMIVQNWEDRATEWSGIPDRVEIMVFIYNSLDGSRLDMVSMQANCSNLAIGETPVKLLRKLSEEYAKSLFN